jgi:hypothetical protein
LIFDLLQVMKFRRLAGYKLIFGTRWDEFFCVCIPGIFQGNAAGRWLRQKPHHKKSQGETIRIMFIRPDIE